jgi:hypothetical protein
VVRARSTFRHRDLTRAVKAATAAGVGIARKRLPHRRSSEILGFRCGNSRSVATVSFFPDGSLVEAAKYRAVASIALQCGVPRDNICRSLLRDPQAAARTPLGVTLDLFAED